MVTAVEIYKEIRRLQLEGITSQRAAAKQLGISRNTVKKYWNGDTVPWDRKEYERKPAVITDDIRQFITECLDEDDRENLRKQKHTARRIYHRLVEQKGFAGGESSIRRAVHSIRQERSTHKDVYVPLSYGPGEGLQIDWGEAMVWWSGERQMIQLFCARSCYSCAPFVCAYRRQNQESFLDAITKTLHYFGGTPKQLIFDNAKVAVKSGFGALAVAQDKYAQLAAHYGFGVVFCNPASGNEKGLVENLVGYIRRNVCVPLPRCNNLDELNAKLLEQCKKYLSHRIERRVQNVGELLKQEQAALYSLPKYQLDISKKYYPVVGRYTTVLVDTNHYSVPCSYRGKTITAKAFPEYIECWYEGTMIAKHQRLFGHREESTDIRHYLPILAERGRAIPHARPVKQFVPQEFIEWMQEQKLSARQMVEALEACLDNDYKVVMEHIPAPKAEIPAVVDEIGVDSVDLSRYDSLCRKGAVI